MPKKKAVRRKARRRLPVALDAAGGTETRAQVEADLAAVAELAGALVVVRERRGGPRLIYRKAARR